MAPKAKDGSIELLRGWAILAVLLVHTSMYFKYCKSVDLLVLANITIDVIAQVAVPLFIFISGFVLALNNQLPLNYKQFYKKRFGIILPQYFFVSCLYLYIFTPNISFLSMIKSIIIFNASFHLWFFKVLFGIYLFYPIIRKKYEHFLLNNQYKSLIFYAVILQLIWTAGNAFSSKSTIMNMLLFSTTFLGYIIYFLLGMFAYSYKENLIQLVLRNKLKILSLILIVIIPIVTTWIDLFFGEKNYILTLGRIVLEPILFVLIITYLFTISNTTSKSNSIFNRLLLYLGNYSFGIYLIHVFYLRIFVNFVAPALMIEMYSVWFYVDLFLFMTILSIMTVSLVSRVPYSHLIIGKINRNQFAA